MKESTIEYVHKRFGTSKEELRKLNVATNQTCQEVPSQTFDASVKNNLSNNKVPSRRSLWSDEVKNMEMNNSVNKV